MRISLDTTITYQNLLDSTNRITQHIGGTRSGKTYAILQYLLTEGLKNKSDITIVRKTFPSLKRSVMKDWKDILMRLDIWDEGKWNGSDKQYTLQSGTTITFLNTDNPDKLRGVKSDILFIDEASEIDPESYFQLSIRTSKQIILAFNPTISPYHWLRQMEECDRYTTNYKDNPFLPKEMILAIEDLKDKSPKKWLIYGKGEYAPNERAVYAFEIVEGYEGEFVGFGLDWGWNDKMSMVAIYKNGEYLYIEELIYESQMTMSDLIKRLKGIGVEREEIWCDSSEPRSIEELYRAGFNAKAVKKGPDSVRFGISILQNWKLCVPKTSQNLINEIYGYQYGEDKGGYVTDTPEGGLDHLLDAMRYVAMMKLSIKSQAKGKYQIAFK